MKVIDDILNDLKEPNETAVILTKESKGYFLFIGNRTIYNTWAITEDELNSLVKLAIPYCNKGTKDAIIKVLKKEN